MAGEWEKVPLDQIYDIGSGLSKPRSEFGFGQGFLTFKDVFYNYFVPEKLNELVNSTEEDQNSCSIKRGDVFLTRTSETMDELGMSCVALRDYDFATFNGFTKRLRPKDGAKVVPEYAGFYFRSPQFRQAVTAMSTLSTRASLNNEMISRLNIVLPSVEEQTAIGFTLKCLGDKIELNRKMNETLEAMTQALFKSWFVNFDPVHAKAEGRDTGLPKEVADLFPSEFQKSELGKIPKGWSASSIYESADIIYGAPFSSNQFNSERIGKPLIRIRDLSSELPSVWTTEEHPKGYVVRPGDIVVGMDGEFRPYLWGGQECWLNQRVCVFVPKPSYSAVFVRNSIFRLLNEIEETETATTVIHLGKNDIDRFLVVIPSSPVLAAFNKMGQPLYDCIVSNKLELHNLVNVRDVLLPKLISGKLTVAAFMENKNE